ncbi:hypothetical protein XM38_004800 [Halomicronema hongdechloris C2206]|uniref:Leucine-rich repeat domain-containing protein n=1 Tax=Halomicronema hongdechloris C2206 TaxID=1641165 RepID=A0A1Z3HH10_9CYAN|nr:hypothetical protein [Halomicronema hongdechloris]ASC69553.1 hypothetical protein XM38_004800 [Halomicronema hongdechloris C2206]
MTLISQEDTLVLERLELQDLRPLASFTQVTWLSLSMNQIEDVTPFPRPLQPPGRRNDCLD